MGVNDRRCPTSIAAATDHARPLMGSSVNRVGTFWISLRAMTYCQETP
jgi:hypothetical protein